MSRPAQSEFSTGKTNFSNFFSLLQSRCYVKAKVTIIWISVLIGEAIENLCGKGVLSDTPNFSELVTLTELSMKILEPNFF